MAEVAVQRSREQALREALREIRTALDRHKRAADQGQISRQAGDSGYPQSLDVLVNGVPLVGDKDGRRLYLLRRLPRDPFADPELSAVRSWGQRSYASPPDAPRSGEDVFDVYSRHPGKASTASRTRNGDAHATLNLQARLARLHAHGTGGGDDPHRPAADHCAAAYMDALDRGKQRVLERNVTLMREAIDQHYGDLAATRNNCRTWSRAATCARFRPIRSPRPPPGW